MKIHVAFPILLALVLLAGDPRGYGLSNGQETKKLNAVLLSVIDGDTVKVNAPNGEQNVRLLYIDAMEKSYNSKMRRDIRQFEMQGIHVKKKELIALGKLAKIYLASILKENDPLTIEVVIGNEKDRYGRTLGVIYKGEQNINLLLVRSGYARSYFVGIVPEDIRKTYLQAEEMARSENRTIWKYLKQ